MQLALETGDAAGDRTKYKQSVVTSDLLTFSLGHTSLVTSEIKIHEDGDSRVIG